MAEKFQARVFDVQGMQLALEKSGEPCLIQGRGDRDAEAARRKVISLHPIS